MRKRIHRRGVICRVVGIAVAIVCGGCSITSVGIDTPDGKAFATEIQRLPKTSTDDAPRMALRIPGASIEEDRQGQISLAFVASSQRLILDAPPADSTNAPSMYFLRNAGGFFDGIVAIKIAERTVGMIPQALAGQIKNPTSCCREESIELARELLGNADGRITGRVGHWRIDSPLILSPDDRSLLNTLINS